MEESVPPPIVIAAPRPRRRRIWPILAGIVFVIVLGIGGFLTASALEEQDSFCISCHTVPETTYYNRAYFALDNPSVTVTDLATAHYHLAQQNNTAAFACISCHRGDASLGHRISTLALAGRDTLIYVLGKEDPTIEKSHTKEGWLPNAACLSCHAETLLVLEGIDNHFHTHLPQAATALANGGTLSVPDRLQAQKQTLLSAGLETVNTPLVCSDCHQAHATLANGAASFFMDAVRRDDACVSCHHIAKKGPQDANSLK
jgi:nitrate/TMAO reductase-like tetraheme cytochrome c subunit